MSHTHIYVYNTCIYANIHIHTHAHTNTHTHTQTQMQAYFTFVKLKRSVKKNVVKEVAKEQRHKVATFCKIIKVRNTLLHAERHKLTSVAMSGLNWIWWFQKRIQYNFFNMFQFLKFDCYISALILKNTTIVNKLWFIQRYHCCDWTCLTIRTNIFYGFADNQPLLTMGFNGNNASVKYI